jgi:phage FluMu protein Com
MTKFLDDTPIELVCDKCSHKFVALVREINADLQLSCPNCGDLNDTQQARAYLAFAEKQALDFSSFIGTLGKPRN